MRFFRVRRSQIWTTEKEILWAKWDRPGAGASPAGNIWLNSIFLRFKLTFFFLKCHRQTRAPCDKKKVFRLCCTCWEPEIPPFCWTEATHTGLDFYICSLLGEYGAWVEFFWGLQKYKCSVCRPAYLYLPDTMHVQIAWFPLEPNVASFLPTVGEPAKKAAAIMHLSWRVRSYCIALASARCH